MSQIHKLSFCIASKLSECCAEFVVNKGVEVNLDMVFEYHEWLLENLEFPMYILLNKMFPCTYSFEAQVQLASLQHINAMAVVAYDKVSQSTTQILQTVPREGNWSIEVFDDRDTAISWLNRQREIHENQAQISRKSIAR